MGALFTFAPAPNASTPTAILARVGVSYISSAQACANAEAEIPDFDFDGVRQASFDEWDELLARVQVNTTGVDADTVELLYSSVSECGKCGWGGALMACGLGSCTGPISPRLIVSPFVRRTAAPSDDV